jgi:type III pantothenate kinase
MTAPLIAVGIGNTSVKLGVTTDLNDSSWPIWKSRHEFATANFDVSTLADLIAEEEVEWRVASVQRNAEKSLCEWVRIHRSHDTYHLMSVADLPIEIHVDAPDRVGLDRLAAAVAANQLRDGRPAVVIDAGTAITVNLIGADGCFEGGVILPGFALTAKALAVGTDLLPLITADLNADPPSVVGKSTEAAIRSGLFWGNVGAVREIVERIASELHETPRVFVTGGDARRLAGFVSIEANYIPDLVLAGIVLSGIQLSKRKR